MKALSLFSGCGGDTLGMLGAGINVTHYSELNNKFQQTHDLNFKKCKFIGGDITKIEDEVFQNINVDIIFAGFPCQSFSHGGKKDPNDPRGQLFYEFIRATKYIKPKYIIGENVKGLLKRKTNQDMFFIDLIFEEFRKIGYHCHYKLFNVSKYGVPQVRERLIILGSRDPQWVPRWPQEVPQVPDLKNIIKKSLWGALEVPEDFFTRHEVPQECITNVDDQEPEGPIHPYLTRQMNQGEFSFGRRCGATHCEIVDIRKPSKTIICTYDHQPRLYVPLKSRGRNYIRPFVLDELKEIQGFPKEFKIESSHKDGVIQLGNAVPPPLITRICSNLV